MRSETCRNMHSGSALIEAMVAVLVFSFGILALVSMQAAAIRSTADAKYRSDAAFLANQIIGQMWGELPANLANYANGASATAAGATACPAGAAAATSATASAWLDEVLNLLPGAAHNRQQVTVVAGAAPAPTVVTVRICWLDRSASPAAYHNHVVTAQISKN